MNLRECLRQIQDGAVSSDMPVAELLRRCQVLAARVKLPMMGEWVRYELNGYPENAELPEYRILIGTAQGHFFGPGGRSLQYADLPVSNMPSVYRDWARKAYLRQPIASLEEVANGNKVKPTVTIPWPPEVVRQVQDGFYSHFLLVQAWLNISYTQFVGVVDSVRNRILSFTIEAEPYMTESEEDPPKPATQLANVFQTNIYGPVSNLAQGSTQFAQHAGVAAGDLSTLLVELQRIGLPHEEITALQEAITEEKPQAGKFGPRVADWVGQAVSKALSGTWSIATSTATEVIPKLIERYYGISK